MVEAKYRVTIASSGSTVRVLSIQMSKNGDIFIAVRTGDKARDLGRLRGDPGSADHDVDIQELRYTIHPSTRSPTLNRANVHFVLRNGSEIHISGQTNAIKSASGFVFLCSRWGSDIFPIKEKGRATYCSLGGFDASTFTMHWSIFVSSPLVKLREDDLSVNVTSIIVGGFRISVLWSFIPLFSLFAGSTINLAHPSSMQEGSRVANFISLEDNEVFRFHKDINRIFFDDLLSLTMSRMVFDTLEDEMLVRAALGRYGMMRVGDKNSFEYQVYEAGKPSPSTRKFNVGVHT